MIEDDPDYDASVRALVAKIDSAINTDAAEFSVRVNALLMLLAMAGAQSALTRDEFFSSVTWQLGEIISHMVVSRHSIQ